MEKAVDVAEKNMSRFGLSQAEISNRRKWVMQTRKKVTICCTWSMEMLQVQPDSLTVQALATSHLA